MMNNQEYQLCEICDNVVWYNYCSPCGEKVCVICHTEYGCPELS